MKPNEEQKLAIQRLADKHADLKRAELTAADRLRRLVEEELNVLVVERSQLANEALRLGVSKTRIGQAMKTSDWNTVRKVLALTAPHEEPEANVSAVAGKGWVFDLEEMVLTIDRWPNRINRKTEERTLRVPVHREWFDLFPVGRWELIADDYMNDVYKHGVEREWMEATLAEAAQGAGITDEPAPANAKPIEQGDTSGWLIPPDMQLADEPEDEETQVDYYGNMAAYAQNPDAWDEE